MKVRVITTGGTIAKIYNEDDGSLRPDSPIVESILIGLRQPDLTIRCQHLLEKDSLELTDEDRTMILFAVRGAVASEDAVIVIHGTDTMEVTGEMLCREIKNPPIPIIMTGAMRPYEFRNSDAVQNVTEALLACRLVEPGMYVSMHNRVLKFPGVVKDRASLSFTRKS